MRVMSGATTAGRVRLSGRMREPLSELRILGAQPLDLGAIDRDDDTGRQRPHARLAEPVLREERPLADNGAGTELEQARVGSLDDDRALDDDVEAGAGLATFGQDLSRPERQPRAGGLELVQIVVCHAPSIAPGASSPRPCRRTRRAA